MYWEWILGASGPHHRTTHLWNVLAGFGETESRSRRWCTRDQGTPISLPQEREECSLFARMFLSDFWLSVWGHFSVTLLSHICFRLFLFQYGSDWQLLHLFLFLELVLHFLSVSEIFLYTVWRRKTFIQRTEFFLGWILSRERASSQGHMFGAAGPVKLDLNLEDFLEPGVRQLWRSNWWSYGWVWGLSGTSFPPPADLQVSGKWRGQDCCWCGCSLRITCPDSVLSLSN